MFNEKLSISALVAATFVLGGCLGSGSSGGGVTGPITELPEVDGEPTGTIEAHLKATYSGTMIATFTEGSQGMRSAAEDTDEDGEKTTTNFSGDLRLDVDTARDPQITAAADNFRFQEDGGTPTLAEGILEGEGTVDMHYGTLEFTLVGELSVAGDGNPATANLRGDGTFYGGDADQVSGDLTGSLSGTDEDGAWFDTGTGKFLLIRDGSK